MAWSEWRKFGELELVASNLKGNIEQTIDISAIYSNYNSLNKDSFLFEIVSMNGEINSNVKGTAPASVSFETTYENGILSISKGNIGLWAISQTSHYFSSYPIYNVYIK